MLVQHDKIAEFATLFQEFAITYPTTAGGQQHVTFYKNARAQARQNLESIVAMSERGQDITEAVLFSVNLRPQWATDLRPHGASEIARV